VKGKSARKIGAEGRGAKNFSSSTRKNDYKSSRGYNRSLQTAEKDRNAVGDIRGVSSEGGDRGHLFPNKNQVCQRL